MAKKRKLPCGRMVDAQDKNLDAKTKDALRARYEEFHRLRGLNSSQVRNRIFDALLDYGDHFTGPELVDWVKDLPERIGAATVYRNLPLFVEAGLLRESLNDADGQIVYEIEGTEHHDHIVCLDCREIIEFFEPSIEAAQEKILSKYRFEELQHRHTIYARCAYKK